MGGLGRRWRSREIGAIEGDSELGGLHASLGMSKLESELCDGTGELPDEGVKGSWYF